MCSPLPIDIVYTWVNGSDPVLLRDLAAVKLQVEVPHPFNPRTVLPCLQTRTPARMHALRGLADTSSPRTDFLAGFRCVQLEKNLTIEANRTRWNLERLRRLNASRLNNSGERSNLLLLCTRAWPLALVASALSCYHLR